MYRAGFSLSRVLFRKNVGPLPNTPPFSLKNDDLFIFYSHHYRPVLQCHPPHFLTSTFLLSTVNFINFTARLNSHDTHTDSVVSITPKQKFAGSLVGDPFCGAIVRPNMLNMLKSASVYVVTVRYLGLFVDSGQRLGWSEQVYNLHENVFIP